MLRLDCDVSVSVTAFNAKQLQHTKSRTIDPLIISSFCLDALRDTPTISVISKSLPCVLYPVFKIPCNSMYITLQTISRFYATSKQY